MNKTLVWVITSLIVGGLIGFYLTTGDPQTTQPTLILPASAEKLSECVPSMGFHYADPATMPFGPVYILDQEDNIVAIEYIIAESELEEDLIETPHGNTGMSAVMDPFDITYDHVDLTYLPDGIDGYEVPHYQVHYFVIPDSERASVCEGLS